MSRWKRQALSGALSSSLSLTSSGTVGTGDIASGFIATSTVEVPFTTTTTIHIFSPTTTSGLPMTTPSTVYMTNPTATVTRYTTAVVTELASTSDSDSEGGISKSALIGGFLGGLMVLVVIGLAGFICLCKRNKARSTKGSMSPPETSRGPSEASEPGVPPTQSPMAQRPDRPGRYEVPTMYDARRESNGSSGHLSAPGSQDDLRRALQLAAAQNNGPRRSPLRSYSRPTGSMTLLSIPETGGRNTRNIDF